MAAYQFVPWNARIKAPAIVDFATNTEIRMPVGGFLREIFVANDQSVVSGQLLARLENRDLVADVRKMKIELQESQLRIRQLRQNEELAAYEVELKNLEALQKRLNERSEQLKGLEVRATIDGIIVADDLSVTMGTYLSAGHKFCSIGSASRMEVHALVSQRDFEQFQNRSGGPVDVLVWGQGRSYFPAVLSQVNPRARVELPHPAFSSVVGGPLPVKYRSLTSEESQKQADEFRSERSQFELIRPHFLARVVLSETDSRRLHAGQPAMVSFRSTRGSIGDVISELITSWLRELRGNQG
jgi:putative peptide zinc metalloprotease protein